MGARQSKRSVDITTTPKKEGIPVEGVVGDAAAPGDGKLEKIEETDGKPTTNGVTPHTDAATPQDKDKDEATEKENEKDETKAENAKVESPTTETPAETAVEATTPTDETPTSPATSPDSKETKKKDKKKKWSFRSISFSKKDKSKPAREDAPKNGDVTKEEPLAEGGEEAETDEAVAASAVSSPADDKTSISSPAMKEQSEEMMEGTAVVAAKPEETKTAPTEATITVASSSPAEAMNSDDKTTASITNPAPVEANKFVDNAKQEDEPAKADKIFESKTENESPVENNVVANDIGTTEVNDEAPKSPPPAVPAEAPAPILGPAITEDVASVTKAIEEIDINEKAVAAAVNENIDMINTNEIIADMNHQNNMNE